MNIVPLYMPAEGVTKHMSVTAHVAYVRVNPESQRGVA
jgi:hypothetical protein